MEPELIVCEPMTAFDIRGCAEDLKAQGWRYVQMCVEMAPDGVSRNLLYTFSKGAEVRFPLIEGIAPSDAIPSISDLFMPAFVFENEAHDLFGIDFEGIVIDFKGRFYDVAVKEPMATVGPRSGAAAPRTRGDAPKAGGDASQAKRGGE